MLDKLIIALFFISVTVTILKATNICDGTCECTEHDIESHLVNIICSDRNLQSIPSIDIWPVNPYGLDLSHNNITSLTSVEESTLLKALDLDNTNLEFIQPKLFQNYPNLIYLDLSQNNLKTLDKDTFSGLENLLTLNISYNNIKVLPNDIFSSLVKLNELRISGNPLRYLNTEFFLPLLEIKFIDISDIEAHSLPDGLFHSLEKLEILDLSRNDFTEVPSSALRSSPNLKELYFNENPIKEFNKESFKYLTKLELLELSEMPKLKRIKEHTFSTLSSLRTLKMSSNGQLQYVDPSAFDGIYNPAQVSTLRLRVIKLRSNSLSTLSANMLPWRAIPILDLQGNPWHCDCYLSWIVNCSIPPELSSDFRCSGPTPNRGKLVKDLHREEFICLHEAAPEYSEALVRIIAAIVGLATVLLVIIVIILVMKRKHIRSWWIFRKRGTGAVYYVKAQTNPTDHVDL